MNRYRITWYRMNPQVATFEVEAESEAAAMKKGEELDNSGRMDWHDDPDRSPDYDTTMDEVVIVDTDELRARAEAAADFAAHPKLPGMEKP